MTARHLADGVSLGELQRRLKRVPGFVGVFTPSTLPHSPRGTLICNYSEPPGSHWIAMTLGDAEPYFFDSYGLPADGADAIIGVQTDFAEYLRRNSARGTYNHNTADLQSIGTSTCGDWAAFYVLHGPPDARNAAWAPLLAEKDSFKRDKMVRELAGVTRDPDIGSVQRGVHLVRDRGKFSLDV